MMQRMSASDQNLSSAMLDWMDRFAPYGVFATDTELRIRRWNQWMTVHSGLDLAAVEGRRIDELYPDLAKRHQLNHFQRALKGEVSVLSTALHGYLLPFPAVAPDSTFAMMRQTARIAPLLAGDQVAGIIGLIEDVTHRESQADTLRRQHARDEILAWALAHLLKSENPRLASRDLFFKVAERMDFDTFALFLAENETLRLASAGGFSPNEELAITTLAASDIPNFPQLSKGNPVIAQEKEAESCPSFAHGATFGFKAYALFPLMEAESLVGFIAFGTKSRRQIAAFETDLLATIAEYLAVSLSREKTDRRLRQAQAQLNEHAHGLEVVVAERTAALKQIIAELQTFSYTVAHDLRAPIRAVRGYSDVLAEDFGSELSEDAKVIVRRLREASMQMDELTRDLLEFSKISRQDIKLETVSLAELVDEVIQSVPSESRTAVKVDPPLHSVLGHRTLIAQCVTNLIENALKFVEKGQAPRVKVWSEALKQDASVVSEANAEFSPSRFSLPESARGHNDESTCVRVWFEDKGIGIPAEIRKKIFGIFERGVTLEEYEGTGIGLAIIARAMERMGGSCGVESSLGQGSRFWLLFKAPTNISAAICEPSDWP